MRPMAGACVASTMQTCKTCACTCAFTCTCTCTCACNTIELPDRTIDRAQSLPPDGGSEHLKQGVDTLQLQEPCRHHPKKTRAGGFLKRTNSVAVFGRCTREFLVNIG